VSPLLLEQDKGSEWMLGDELAPALRDENVVRFAAVGDVGVSGVVQATVAAGVTRACDGRCDFVLLLGDNLYEEGVADDDDAARLACLVSRYPTKRKYMVLGNHDYIITSPELERARNELQWIRDDMGQKRPTGAAGRYHFYRFRAGPARFVGLDTNFLVRGRIDSSYLDLSRWLGRLRPMKDEWVIVFGHHPYVSNGPHGDAGTYRESGFQLWPAPFFQHFMNQQVIARADLYIAGHDHNLQFFSRANGYNTAQLLSGSGAKCNPRGDRATERADMERYGHGFALVEVSRERMVVSFHDYRGRRFWGTWRTRSDPEWRALDGLPKRSIDTRYRCGGEIARMLVEATPELDACQSVPLASKPKAGE
jgi:hypothetical protein